MAVIRYVFGLQFNCENRLEDATEPKRVWGHKSCQKERSKLAHSVDVKAVETNYPNLAARQLDMPLLYAATVHIAVRLVSVTSSIHLFTRCVSTRHHTICV